MKIITEKKKGRYYKGVYTNSCMPNQKPKRARKSSSIEIRTDNPRVKININMIGIYGAIVTLLAVPVTASWKIVLIILFLLSSIHLEKK